MKCVDCKYFRLVRYGDGDLDIDSECDPPQSVCPYIEEWKREVASKTTTEESGKVSSS